MTPRLFFVRSVYIMLSALLIISCATDYDSIDLQNSTLDRDYTVKRLHASDLNSIPKVKGIVESFSKPVSNQYARQSYQSPFGFTVDLDEFIYIGNDKVHSYTFEVLDEKDPQITQNLVLKHMPDSTYEAFLFSYKLSEQDIEDLNNGNGVKNYSNITEVAYLPYNQPNTISADISVSYDCVETTIGYEYNVYTNANGQQEWESIRYYTIDCTWTITIGGGGGGGGTGGGGGGGTGGGGGGGTGGGGTGGGGGGSIGGGGGGSGGGGGGTGGGGSTGGGGNHGGGSGNPVSGGPWVIGGPHQPGFSLNDGSNPTLTLPFVAARGHVAALNKLTKNKADGSKTQVREGIDNLKEKLYTDHVEDGYHYVQNGSSFTVKTPIHRSPNKVEFDDDDETEAGTKVILHMHPEKAEVTEIDEQTGEEVTTLKELVPIFSHGDLDKTAQQFVDLQQDMDLTSILVTTEGTFALRIDNKDEVNHLDYLMNTYPAAKREFYNDFNRDVVNKCEGQSNSCYIENFTNFIYNYKLDGMNLGFVLFKAVEDAQGNITNWQKL